MTKLSASVNVSLKQPIHFFAIVATFGITVTESLISNKPLLIKAFCETDNLKRSFSMKGDLEWMTPPRLPRHPWRGRERRRREQSDKMGRGSSEPGFQHWGIKRLASNVSSAPLQNVPEIFSPVKESRTKKCVQAGLYFFISRFY